MFFFLESVLIEIVFLAFLLSVAIAVGGSLRQIIFGSFPARHPSPLVPDVLKEKSPNPFPSSFPIPFSKEKTQ